jgi:hypothetical protein
LHGVELGINFIVSVSNLTMALAKSSEQVVPQIKCIPLCFLIEINITILEYIFERVPAGKTTPLLAVLRSAESLYREALRVYNNLTMVRLAAKLPGLRYDRALQDLPGVILPFFFEALGRSDKLISG